MKAGLYTTIAFHLVALIILLSITISQAASPESSFVLDFTRQEEIEAAQKEMAFKEEVSRELDEQFGQTQTKIRNVAVDASRLKDDRNTDVNALNREAKDLQKKLDASRRDAIAQEKALEDEVNTGAAPDRATEAAAYRGPSVVSYKLEGRKAGYLHIPAYKGYNGGDVYVTIVVNRKGKVISAKTNKSISVNDPQLHELAEEAARRSFFSAKSDAQEAQVGEIVYRFVKQ